MPKPLRSANGYRDYGNRELEQVLIIRSSRDLGFTVEDIRELLELHQVLASRGQTPMPKPAAQGKMLTAAARRLDSIEEKLRTLQRMKREMKALVGTLQGHEKPVCPVSGMQVA
jgi:DNA-binding transcriptional MerR regulator